jgi:NADH:ubiquinone oxidoreductase subunit F (NADH-binding)
MTDERVRLRDVTDSGFFGTEGTDGPEALDPAVTALVDRLRAGAQPGREGLIRVLLGVQGAFGRVSWRVQELLAELYGMSPAQLAGVVSFYPELSFDRPEDWSSEPADDTTSADGAPATIPVDEPVPTILRSGPVLRRCGTVDPDDLESTMAAGAYRALRRVLTEFDPVTAIDQVKRSGLQERGGEGFPVGLKWTLVAESESDRRFIVGSGSSGDPDPTVDRTLAELDPHALIEGMLIAGFAIGADQGRLLLRSKDARAIGRVERALEQARAHRLVGGEILGSGFDFEIAVAETAGVSMGGEETAVLNLLEGGRAVARCRPPYPAERGLWGRPTLINTFETLANIPLIFSDGPVDGPMPGRTKVIVVFASRGAPVQLEIELGTTIDQVLDQVVDGVRRSRVRAVHLGGAGGATLDRGRFSTPIDYGSIRRLDARLGSGSLLVIDDDECPVSLARRLVESSADESCGTCPSCRIGTRVLGGLLDRFEHGAATAADLIRLEELCLHIRQTSMCELGRGSVNPVLTGLRHLRADYEAHVDKGGCLVEH